MSIEDRIASIQDYFKEMKIAEGVVFIKVSFPKGWVVDKEICNENKIKVTPCKDMSGYYFFCDSKLGADKVFEMVDKIVQINQVAELKKSIFQDKIKELEEIFLEEDIDVLSTLEFKLKKKRTRKKSVSENEPKKDETEVNSENNIEENEKEVVKECQTS